MPISNTSKLEFIPQLNQRVQWLQKKNATTALFASWGDNTISQPIISYDVQLV